MDYKLMPFYRSATNNQKRLFDAIAKLHDEYGEAINDDWLVPSFKAEFGVAGIRGHIEIFTDNFIYPQLEFPMQMIAGNATTPQRFWTRATANSIDDYIRLRKVGFVKSAKQKS